MAALQLLTVILSVATVASLSFIPSRIQQKFRQIQENAWPHAMYKGSMTNVVPPRNLSAHLSFTWHHPKGRFATVLAGGPVIDSENSFYLTGQDALRKLDSNGKQLWEFRPPNSTNNMPALGNSAVLGNDKGGHAFALDMKTGKPLWITQVSSFSGGDSGYPAAYMGLFVMATDMGHTGIEPGGNERILALNETTGSLVWEFHVPIPVWNFQPLFTSDDHIVFMDFSGGMYKVKLYTGELVWHTPAPNSQSSFTDGGAVLGGDLVYSCSNPDKGHGFEGQEGVVRAFRISDGSIVWETILPQPCNSYPAYGPLDGKTAVVVTPGSFVGAPVMHGSIMALDAATGQELWRFQAKPFSHALNMARGDPEGYATRLASHAQDPFVGLMCVPAHWGAPVITGDGTVYAGRMDGLLYQVRAPVVPEALPTAMDFLSSAGVEVETFDALGSPLHGSFAFAPGIMAFQTCDSLWVFKF